MLGHTHPESYAYFCHFLSLPQTAIIAMIVSTTFLQYPKSSIIDANYYMSVCFFSLMFM